MSAAVIRIPADEGDSSWSPAKEKAASRSIYSVRPPPFRWRLRHLLNGAPKIKLLLIGLLLFTAFAIFCWNLSSLMGWNLHRPSSAFSPSRGGFTVLINTRKQNPHLKQTVAHYASCIATDAIRVVWTAKNPPSEALISSLNNTIALSKPRRPYKSKCNFGVDFDHENHSKSRFKLSSEVATDAVFSVDDDVIVPCSALSFAFTTWQAAPSSMVGFVPRMHWIDKLEMRKNGVGYYEYGGWWSVWWKGSYSMVLTQAAFLHKKYLHLYFNNMPSSINHYLMWARNCEDIAMSFLVANATASPPIWVQGKVYETGSSSISSLRREPAEKRNKCLNDLISLYGTVPLVHTHLKAVDSRYELFW